MIMTNSEIKPYVGERETKPYVSWNSYVYSWGAFWRGGDMMNICSLTTETKHGEFGEWDLAHFASIWRDGSGLKWGEDADLMTEQEKKEILSKFGTPEQCTKAFPF